MRRPRQLSLLQVNTHGPAPWRYETSAAAEAAATENGSPRGLFRFAMPDGHSVSSRLTRVRSTFPETMAFGIVLRQQQFARVKRRSRSQTATARCAATANAPKPGRPAIDPVNLEADMVSVLHPRVGTGQTR